jgi:glycosyltransferase involved in cell wall biosynthesis
MLSVLMATHNGADTIERTLAAMSELEPPPGGWRLVVVNNASTDDSEARILKWRDRLPLDYVIEPALGKSNAMNTALDHAAGDFIVMTDDDVLPDRDWLVQWRRAADAYPHCSVFGGAIAPQFDDAPPPWPMPQTCLTVLYAQTPPHAEGEIEPVDVSGPNMAVRRSVADQGWRFAASFMVGANGLMGEDSDFVRRLAAAGHKVGFAPRARVRHIVHKHQTSWWWMQRRFFRHGRTMFVFDDVRRDAASGALQFDFPRWRIRRAGLLMLKLLLAAATMNHARLFMLSRALAYDLGALKQARLMRQALSAPAGGALKA